MSGSHLYQMLLWLILTSILFYFRIYLHPRVCNKILGLWAFFFIFLKFCLNLIPLEILLFTVLDRCPYPLCLVSESILHSRIVISFFLWLQGVLSLIIDKLVIFKKFLLYTFLKFLSVLTMDFKIIMPLIDWSFISLEIVF